MFSDFHFKYVQFENQYMLINVYFGVQVEKVISVWLSTLQMMKYEELFCFILNIRFLVIYIPKKEMKY